jgi:hypothetical protein
MSEEVQIPDSFDAFMNPEPVTESEKDKSEKETLEDRFSRERIQWGGKIKGMSGKLRKALDVAELMTEVYTERQLALEYYHYLISLLIKINKKYNRAFSDKYKFYKYDSQERLPNDKVIQIRVNSELQDIKERREIFDNHAKFMDGTIKTIDNIIFGIKSRIDVEQIARGK